MPDGISVPMVSMDSKDAVGDKMIEAALNDEARDAFMADPKAYLGALVSVPDSHTIIPHVNTKTETHIVVPEGSLVAQRKAAAEAGLYSFPPEYGTIDPAEDGELAYNFRVGDYCFAQCG